MPKFARARSQMIDGQIRTNKVTDTRLLEAMSVIAREDFVPLNMKNVAYIDDSVALGGGRYLLEPLVLARLIQALDLTTDDKVLDIGAGTGYSAAILAHLAGSVVAVEEIPLLIHTADSQLSKFDNVKVVSSPLAEGHANKAPYSAILIEGAVGHIPESIIDQLAEGGRVVAVEAGRGPVGKAKIWRKHGGLMIATTLFEAGVPALAAFAHKRGFEF